MIHISGSIATSEENLKMGPFRVIYWVTVAMDYKDICGLAGNTLV